MIRSNTAVLSGTTTGNTCPQSERLIIQLNSICISTALAVSGPMLCGQLTSVKCHWYIELVYLHYTTLFAKVINMSSTILLVVVIVFLVMTNIPIKTYKSTNLPYYHSDYPPQWTLIDAKWKLLATVQGTMGVMSC